MLLALTAVALLPGTQPSVAADIQVFTSGAPAAVQKKLAPNFTQATGHNAVFTAATLEKVVGAIKGETKPDVLILPVPVMNKLEKSSALRPGSRLDLARVGIGVTVRQGSPLPDVSTVDGLRKTLLAAKSIVHPNPKGGGFTGAHIDRMIEKLGIADVVRPKVVHMFAFAGGVESVAKGNVELGLFNMSEIVPINGVVLVGPFPQELQNYLVFAGAIYAESQSPEPAMAYLRSLREPGARDAWTKGGFELLGEK